MSEVEHQGTNILLPAARVAIFSNDADTVSSVQAFQDDWRFARVEVTVIEGGVDEAVATYQKGDPSPDLLIIQTDNIDDSFTGSLGDLSEYCNEGTAAIIIGPVNDVYLYRTLIEMGISDYLVRPIQPEVFTEVIAKSLIERLGVSDSRLITFMGAKGGVGTSILSQLASVLVSENLGQKTILMDASGGASSSSVGLAFDPSATMLEAYRAVNSGNEDTLNRMFHHVNDKLSVLATGADAMLDRSLSAEQYEEILDHLLVQYPVVIVDLSSADASVRKAVISRASQNVVVSMPTVTSLRFCRSLLGEISDIRGGNVESVSLVLNKRGMAKGHEIPDGDVEEVLEFKPSSVIDYLPSIFLQYESDIQKMLVDKDSASVITAFLPVLKKGFSGSVGSGDDTNKNSGLLGGFLNKLSAK